MRLLSGTRGCPERVQAIRPKLSRAPIVGNGRRSGQYASESKAMLVRAPLPLRRFPAAGIGDRHLCRTGSPPAVSSPLFGSSRHRTGVTPFVAGDRAWATTTSWNRPKGLAALLRAELAARLEPTPARPLPPPQPIDFRAVIDRGTMDLSPRQHSKSPKQASGRRPHPGPRTHLRSAGLGPARSWLPAPASAPACPRRLTISRLPRLGAGRRRRLSRAANPPRREAHAARPPVPVWGTAGGDAGFHAIRLHNCPFQIDSPPLSGAL